MTYQDTSLWKRTLSKEDKNVEPLRESFLEARGNAEFLLDKIRKDFPNLTVHDITHVDSLWNVADTIIGKDYPINPLEGYVLGIAFLIHDAALSYDAVGGKEKLRDTIEWKDAYADGPGEKDEEEFKKDCDFAAIRALHARYAEDILNKKFERDNTTTFYIIGNDEYRTQFGDMIGKIAASHHWSIDDVESNLEIQINPVAGFPSDWEINEQKLACILRCADAGHIDNGRAPFGIYNSLIVNGVSRDHWESQIRLGQVRENRKNPEQLLITSTRPFDKDNFAAWNVAYDAVRLFDEELKKSNELLKPSGLSFPHIGVAGAESKEALSEYIKTHGWQPCSLGVHTSNVKALIENLGGSKLYGEGNLLLVTLRELIQNARDAIYARGTLDEHFKEGKITIRLEEDEGKRFVEVEDNGIGMSLDCIKHHFLDFGSSYWKSSLARFENPGLRSKGFKSIGKFGIGFYSVFIVAKSVDVVTRRFKNEKSKADAWKIEFPAGLTLSPVLSAVDLSPSVSTIVRFELKDDVDMNFVGGLPTINIPFQKILPILVAGLDTDVYFDYNKCNRKIHCNIKSSEFDKEKWIGDLFINPPSDIINPLAKKLEILKDENGNIRGLLLDPKYQAGLTAGFEHVPCIQTIKGLACMHSYGFYDSYVGYLDGIEDGISRNKMIIDETLKTILRRWIKEKYINLPKNTMYNIDYLCPLISFCGLKHDFISYNTKNFYTNLHKFILPEETIDQLIMIQYYLYAGVEREAEIIKIPKIVAKEDISLAGFYDTERRERFSEFVVKKGESISDYIIIGLLRTENKELLNKVMDKLMSDTLGDFQRFKKMAYAIQMNESVCDDLIKKYYYLSESIFAIFPYWRNSIKVWLNVRLNKLINKMVDWEKINDNNINHDKEIDVIINNISSSLISTSEFVNNLKNPFDDIN